MPKGVYERNENHYNQICEAQKKRWELGRIVKYEKEKSGCFVWCNAQDGNGYGCIRVNGKTIKAYKYYYENKYGKVENELELDHLCKNKLCVNPDHLEPVTHEVNIQRAIGKYSTEAIKTIREMNYNGFKSSELSSLFCIPESTVRAIVKNRTWKNV